MTAFNFIPFPRRQQRRISAAVRRWASIAVGYAVVVVAGLVFAAAAWDTDHAALDRSLSELSQHSATQQTNLSTLNAQIDASQLKLAADRAVSVQPDWSILLALLPQCLGEDAALRHLSLQQDPGATDLSAADKSVPRGSPAATPSSKPARPPPDRGFTLRITGVALAQATPSNVVVSLEESRLFDRVKLLETRREPVGKSDAIVFEIECRLAGGADAGGGGGGETSAEKKP